MPALLLIDDDPAIHLAFRTGFQSTGQRLVSTANGEEGVALLPKEEVTVVVLDLNLPQASGQEIFLKVRPSIRNQKP